MKKEPPMRNHAWCVHIALALAVLFPSYLSKQLFGAPVSPREASRILSLRNLGLAQLEEDRPRDARATFAKLAELVPGEAVPWANGAIAALRDNDIVDAEKLLKRALATGERADVHMVRAAIENAKNRPEAVREALAKAAAMDPRALEARWRFVRSVETSPNVPEKDRETARRFLGEIATSSPASLPAKLKLLLLELERGELVPARKLLADVHTFLGNAEPRTLQLVGEASALLERGDAKAASLKIRILENVLRVTPRYQQSLGELFTNVVGLPLVSFSPAFEASLRPKGSAAVPVAFKESTLKAESPDILLRRVDLKNSGTPELYTIPAPYRKAAFFDFDLDGDLDVYLHDGTGPDKLLRNNLDGTFTDVTAGTGDPSFASKKVIPGDFDRDGDIDLLAITAKGELVLRSNLRQGRFTTIPLGVADVIDVAAEDLDGDGFLDIVAATKHGLVLLRNQGDGRFAEKGKESGLMAATGTAALRAVLLADLDNDGFADLIVATDAGLTAFRNDGTGRLAAWPVFSSLSPSKQSSSLSSSPSSFLSSIDSLLALDVDHDGDLDLVVSAGGKTRVLVNEGGNANAWIDVVLEGLPAGSGKVNRAGVGSLVEVKAGDLYVARTVGLLPTHVGLGVRSKADVVRCLWTNGIPQNVLDAKARAVVKEVQQLKGSCPFVYAFNGAAGRWSFVSDALGRAPIGLLYDGVHLAGADTREWLLIDGESLTPTADGELLIDYTEELWEVGYLDEATLMAVDHPEGTHIVPNERMIPGAMEKKLFTVRDRRPVRAASSDASGTLEDVTDRVARRDGIYADPGPETAYQGVRREHSLILDLGRVSPGDRVVLYLTGWIFYTDTSINVSLSQRSDIRPLAPLLEVPDGKGGWNTAMEAFGFPAGKTKTMPVDLTGLIDPKDTRVRIRTTMAVFWDEIFVTVNDPVVPVVMTRLSPSSAVLSERGFSRRTRETPDGPELFDHEDVSTDPKWEDLPGFVTRLGDVTGLLMKTDDRWVAFKGGDAIRISYDASKLPPLPAGWRRDWVLISDGWDKDFDKNTVTGQTYEPWPFHAMSAYPYPDSERHPDQEFLKEWLTRRVGPEKFRRVLAP